MPRSATIHDIDSTLAALIERSRQTFLTSLERVDGPDRYGFTFYPDKQAKSKFIWCHSRPEAELFLRLLGDRAESGEPLDWDVVQKAIDAVENEALCSAADDYTDEFDKDSLPYEGEADTWMVEGLGLPHPYSYEVIICTASWSEFGAPRPKAEPLALRIPGNISSVHSEKTVDLRPGDPEFEEICGFAEGSLEWFLWLSELCHNEDLTKGTPPYAYELYSIAAALWLPPDPENIKLLKRVIKAGPGEVESASEDLILEGAISAWLDECEQRYDPEEHRTEPEKFAALIAEYRSAIASPDAWFEYINGEKS